MGIQRENSLVNTMESKPSGCLTFRSTHNIVRVSAFILLSASISVLTFLAGCSTSQKMDEAQLDSLGVRPGANYWEATSQLSRQGYKCFVSGAKRENFDCTKKVGFMPTCILRVTFVVNDQNKITTISVPEPACMGTP